MFYPKMNCEIRVIPKNEKFTILGTFGDHESYLYFTSDGSLVISDRKIIEGDIIITYHKKQYSVVVESEKEYDSIGKLIEYCLDIGVKEIALISRALFDDTLTFKCKKDITSNLYKIR
jgi:hypothetical protein